MTRAHLRITVAATAALLTSLIGLAVTAPTASATYAGKDGRIAFVRHDQIYTIRADGTGIHRLTSVGTNSHPKWSPTGRRIAFVHETSAGATDLWVMSATGSAKRQVTHLGNVTEPTWSPHGKYLAFGGVDGLEKVRSTAPFGSPTVLSAYYTNTSCCGDELPSEAHPLSVDRFVAWSPDGRIAVWNHDSPQFDDVLWMYYPRTGEARTYLETGAACCGNLDVVDLFWGPTGTFGYAATDNSEEPQPSTIVYPGYVGEPGDTGPAPDPSGTKIALTNPSSGRSHIYVQAIDGTHRRFLACGSQPDWQAIR